MSTGRVWASALAVVLVLVLVLVLGLRTPDVEPGGDAALGPEGGAEVSEYLDDAHGRLEGVADTRWALASPSSALTPADAARLADGTRTSEVLLRVPIDRVQTPLVAVQVADQGDVDALEQELTSAERLVGGRLLDGVPPGRPGAVAQVSGRRLRAGCACIVGLVLRGGGSELRDVAARSGVRGVEVAPSGTNYGRLSVAPLLPSQTTTVIPGPDDGPVPAG